jgi:hypothetical protein
MVQRPPPNSEDPTLEQETPEFDSTSTDQLDGTFQVVESIQDAHVCDSNGLPTSVADEINGDAVYATCATCGKPQVI